MTFGRMVPLGAQGQQQSPSDGHKHKASALSMSQIRGSLQWRLRNMGKSELADIESKNSKLDIL
jgi:hypothetical protein